MKQRIPDSIYGQILENTVVSAVDAIIHQDEKVLVALRKQEPCKGQWWIPGGRQEKGETGEEAIVREVREETGLDVKVERFVGVYDAIFDKTAFPNVKTGVHYVARVYLVTPQDGAQNVRLDSTQRNFRWIDKIEDDLNDYVRVALKQSGVFERR